jgi:multidrug resistance efflux pump
MLVSAALLAVGVVSVFRSDQSAAAEPTPEKSAAPVLRTSSGRGAIVCARTAQIRSKVRGTSEILELVEEGRKVKSGEILVRFGSGSLEEESNRQRIAYEASRAAVTQARAALSRAEIANVEYVEGLYPLEKKTAELGAALAEHRLQRVERALARTQKLPDDEPTKKDQLDDAEFAVLTGKLELEIARIRLEVLQKFTHARKLEQLKGEIAVAKAKLAAAEAAHQLDENGLNKIVEQLEQCVIKAPFGGYVVYSLPSGRGRTTKPTLGKSMLVREGQPILELHDTTELAIKVPLNRRALPHVRKGMPATIRVDALPDLRFTGRVEDVQGRTPPAGQRAADRQGGEVTVSIENPSEKLLPGLTGEAVIELAREKQSLDKDRKND